MKLRSTFYLDNLNTIMVDQFSGECHLYEFSKGTRIPFRIIIKYFNKYDDPRILLASSEVEMLKEYFLQKYEEYKAVKFRFGPIKKAKKCTPNHRKSEAAPLKHICRKLIYTPVGGR